ncbi:unnamed protein product [Microthlaspi erraticum]|uniref:GAG-pre-integrase domain-containing protein n=1 Tax=Microthlaspi erraticum TaxID=1685480 RepID=A0A6D2HXV8_9BRAS|nr:unnamed protein product [Microthlaspi erraticum]
MAGDEVVDAAVVVRSKEMSPSMTCPMLNATNYAVWMMKMKVLLRIHKVWEAIEPGSISLEKNDIATGLIFQSILEYLVLQVGGKETAKEIWDAIKTRNLGADRVKEARLQTLNGDFERLKMKDTDTVEYFAGKLTEIASKSASLGQVMEESKLVKKFLNSLPMGKFFQIAASLEQILDLNTTSFEDVVGRLKAYEERIHQGEYGGATQDKLLYAKSDERGDTSSSEGKEGHYASKCPTRKPKIEEANKVETEEADSALYMHEIVFLNEENLIPKNYEIQRGEEGVWYLDNGASNHMTSVKEYFSELNEKIKGKVKFGDGSCVEIGGKGSILFQSKAGEQKLVSEIYYIPNLKSNILSLGQATEAGCDVRMSQDYLTVHDPRGRLLVKVMRSPNRLYKLSLKIGKPICLHSNIEDDTWRWHARLGHISVGTLKAIFQHEMAYGLPEIREVETL